DRVEPRPILAKRRRRMSGAWGTRELAQRQGDVDESRVAKAVTAASGRALQYVSAVKGAILVPGVPHLLAADPARSWRELAAAARAAGEVLRAEELDALLMMSTQWFTVLGHQFQARANLEGTYVDENWYDFEYGTFAYRLTTHGQLTRAWAENA